MNGYLCKKQDVDTLADCMRKFLDLNTDQRVEMGKQARAKMEKEFDKNLIVEQSVDVILNRKRRNLWHL